MKPRINFNLSRMVPMVLFYVLLFISGCGGSSHVNDRLDAAESLMESRPDSALAILDIINATDLKGDGEKARYALLKSMALDKNYVDTTDFYVLQPAIDYYLKKGSPDEKLRTYYYQGRIYQNRNEGDSAILSFLRGMDIVSDCKDSLTIARNLVAQGIIYKKLYDFRGYSDNYLKAAHIYKSKKLSYLEFDCLLNGLSGMIILQDQVKSDSILTLLTKIDSLNDAQKERLKMKLFRLF